jgi:LysR family transcriptional regulator of gallate degradation
VMNALPNLRVRIIEQIDNLFTSLLEGKFDLLAATITSEAPRFGLRRMFMFDDHLVIIAKPGHPVTQLKSPSAKDLSGFRWVFSSAGNLHRKRLEKFFESENTPLPRPIAETSAPNLIKSIVLQTDCIALMAKMGAQADLDAGVLDHVKIDSPFMLRTIGLLWRSSHPLPAAAKNVMSMIATICRERGHNPQLLPAE